MTQLKETAKVVLLFVCIIIGLEAVKVIREFRQVTLPSVTALISRTDTQLNGGTGVQGVLPQVRAVLRDTRADATLLNRQEKQYYASLQRHTDLTFAGVEATITTLNAKLDAADVAGISADTRGLLVALTTDAQHVTPVLDQLRATIADADRQINDPAISASLKSLAATSQGSAEFMVHLNDIIADVQGSVNKATHPSKKSRALSALLTALKTLYYVSQVVK